jgi:hypothetical protein
VYPMVPTPLIGPLRKGVHPSDVGEGLGIRQGGRGLLPGTSTSNASRKGIIAMQRSPEDLNHTCEQGPSGPSLLPLGICPKRRPDVRSRLIDGEAVVLDQQASVIHQFNATASYIWECSDGQSTIADIAHQLASAFDVDPAVAARDARTIIRQFQALQLLEVG